MHWGKVIAIDANEDSQAVAENVSLLAAHGEDQATAPPIVSYTWLAARSWVARKIVHAELQTPRAGMSDLLPELPPGVFLKEDGVTMPTSTRWSG